jgi:hypothetical protein
VIFRIRRSKTQINVGLLLILSNIIEQLRTTNISGVRVQQRGCGTGMRDEGIFREEELNKRPVDDNLSKATI